MYMIHRKTKILMKETKYLNKWRESPCSWTEDSRCQFFQLRYRHNAVPTKIPVWWFCLFVHFW